MTEAGLSRTYAGIHYQFDIDAGQALGIAAARQALRFDRRRGMLAAIR
jgi:membrane-associated phospholipid phosphatase